VVRHAGGVLAGLGLDAGQGGAGLLGFDDAGGPAIDVEEIVGGAVARFEGELPDGHAATGVEIDGARILHGPAGRDEGGVDRLAGGGFG